jgi:hypothetical protein
MEQKANDLVPGQARGVESPEDSTPATGEGVAQEVTTQTGQPDAEGWRQKYKELEEKFERDLGRLKSVFQRREHETQQEWEQRRREYEDEIHRLRTATMDEDERRAYEYEMMQARMTEQEREIQRLQEQAQQAQAMSEYMQFFLAQGIPAEQLDLSQGVEGLIQSGWEAITRQLEELRQQVQQVSAPPSEPPKPSEKQPPTVITKTGGTPTGPTWADLIQRYGSAENVYRMVEQKILPPDIIPSP